MKLTAIMHKGCGGIAFMYDEKRLGYGIHIAAEYARAVDGSLIEPLTVMRCTSCGAPIKFASSKDRTVE